MLKRKFNCQQLYVLSSFPIQFLFKEIVHLLNICKSEIFKRVEEEILEIFII